MMGYGRKLMFCEYAVFAFAGERERQVQNGVNIILRFSALSLGFFLIFTPFFPCMLALDSLPFLN